VECPGEGWVIGRRLPSDPARATNENLCGRQFWTNGVINRYCKICPGEDWIAGRAHPRPYASRKQQSDTIRGRKLWNNGIIMKTSKICPGEGYVLGNLYDAETKQRMSKGQKGLGWWTDGVKSAHKRMSW